MTKRSKKAKNFIRTPGYPGGRQALQEFIRNNLKYPEKALENRIEGNVQVRFTLDQDGKVIEAKIINGIGYGCDEEALRIVKMLRFKGVKNRGVRASFDKTITIPFRLDKTNKKKIEQKIIYQLAPSSETKKKNTYTYTISVYKKE